MIEIWRGTQEAEGTGFEYQQAGNSRAGVQIPLSPPSPAYVGLFLYGIFIPSFAIALLLRVLKKHLGYRCFTRTLDIFHHISFAVDFLFHLDSRLHQMFQ